jgi:hypothetical protein
MSLMDGLIKKRNGMSEQAALDRTPAGEPLDGAMEEALSQALVDFKLSVHAWSDAELSRPRMVAQGVRRRSWRLAASVALGCMLVAAGVSGGVYEQHERHEAARIAAEARAAEQQKLVAAEKARQDEEDLLAKVDSDVSRETPSAMEPLAQLMAEDESQQ